jgi:selenium metabolism protein YedF
MKRTVVINSKTLGSGSDELGRNLMGSFLRKLWASDAKPDAIIFYNAGVTLLAEGSPVLDALDALFKAGVDLIACGTCVAYYKLEDKLVGGRVSTMQEIVSVMLTSDSVITV